MGPCSPSTLPTALMGANQNERRPALWPTFEFCKMCCLSWGTRTRTLNNSTRNCCVTNYTIPHRASPWNGKCNNRPRSVTLDSQPVIDSSRLKPMIRPSAIPAASSISRAVASLPRTGLVRVGDT